MESAYVGGYLRKTFPQGDFRTTFIFGIYSDNYNFGYSFDLGSLNGKIFGFNSSIHGDIIVDAKPIGGFRMIDGSEADDKIIAVLNNDAVYGNYNDIHEQNLWFHRAGQLSTGILLLCV